MLERQRAERTNLRCKIVQPSKSQSMSIITCKTGTDQGHELPHSSLNWKSFAALDANHCALRGKGREHDIGAIRLKNLAKFVQSCE